jgi:zinc protease
MRRLSTPLMLIAFVIASQLSCTQQPAAESPAASSSPTEQAIVDEILQRYEQALGGKEAIDAITSQKMKGRFQLAGMEGSVEAWSKDPNKTLAVVEFPRIGTLKKGFDGEARWVQTPGGTFSDSSPQEIAELERDADVYSAGKIKTLFESMKLENKARLNGRDVYVIEGKPARGPAEKLFFDVENGLLVRWDMARRKEGRGTVFVKVHLDDYKDVSGVKVPFKVRFGFESFNFTVQVDELEYNIPIDDAMFMKPSR